MKQYVYYTPGGEIVSISQLQDGVDAPNLGWCECVQIDGEVSGDTHRVDSGLAVRYSNAGIERRRNRPAEFSVWNAAAEQWEDPRTLDGLKAAKNAAINDARLRANQSHFTFDGKQIATDPLSRSDIDGAHGIIVATGALPPGWPGGWKAMDNTICPILDVPTWLAFYGAMVAQGTANFNHSQALKAQLAAATTPAEVEAVPDW